MESRKRERRANKQAWQPERRRPFTTEIAMIWMIVIFLAAFLAVVCLSVCSRVNDCGVDE